MDIQQINNRVGWLVADYLDKSSCAIDKKLLDSVIPDADPITEEVVYKALLEGLLGLDPDSDKEDAFIVENYLQPGVRRLDTNKYLDNPYYRTIKFNPAKFGEWELSFQTYQPYEAFLRDDIELTDDLRQIPRLGYFSEGFEYPSVLQNGREWMSIKPSEIESSQTAIDAAVGDVVTFGLGLGYFAFMASQKKDVKSVTVVELSQEVISLFERYILPQFPHREKVHIVRSDAFEYLERGMDGLKPDFAFVDIWHDISDGEGLYVKAKQYECKFPKTRFSYWIETSIRCSLINYLENLTVPGDARSVS